MGYGKFKFVIWTNDKFDITLEKVKGMMEKYTWSYVICGRENCPSTNREHLDGYYEYPTPRKIKTELNKFNKVFGKGFGDLQIARGSAAENYDYSTKEGKDFFEEGAPAVQGARKDLAQAHLEVKNGKSVDIICQEDPEIFHMYGRTLEKLEQIYQRKTWRTEMTKGIWYYGPTGVGKSVKAYEGFHPDTHYNYVDDNGWWDNYVGQEIVVINDFRGKIPYDLMLNLIDWVPLSVKRRGKAPMPFTSKKIIITSSLSPTECYHNREENDKIEQLLRRLEVVKMDGNSTTVWSGNTITDQSSKTMTEKMSIDKGIFELI